MSFFSELMRRNVFRVAAVYIIVTWLILQVVDVVAPMLHLPEWVSTLVLLLLAVGFLPTLILAWAYDLTPEGLKLEKNMERSESTASRTRQKLNLLIIYVLALAVVFFAVDKFVLVGEEQSTTTLATPDSRSVAVIPFSDLSRDESNMPFVDGVHDDLLTQLSRIDSIRTTSRTSVMQYRDTAKTIPQIAEELGVATILEGGVQRAGNRVRINVQLIDAATDEHLWADTYDRDLTATNVFAIQSEIASSVVEALQATLSVEEQQRLANVPTENIEALELYFAGRQLWATRSEEAIEQSVRYFERAIELDPDFALAHAGLADAYLVLPEYSASIDRKIVWGRSEAAAETALALDPDLPEALTSMAWSRLIHNYDWQEAERLLWRAVEIQSNNADSLHWLSHVLSWQGRHEEALRWARQAVEADPLSNLMKGNLGYILMDAGEFDRAIAIDDELLEREPNSSRMRNLWLTYLRAGRPEEAANALERWASATDRDPEAAEEVGGLFIQYKDTGEPAFLSSDLVARLEIGSEDLAQVYAFIGDRESTLAALESAYRERSGSRSVLSMKVNPGYDFVRDNPRFVELMRLVRLQE